ncbi:MAG: hypothetical protein ACLS9Y_11435 [Ruthenibacterium lactatiformans]
MGFIGENGAGKTTTIKSILACCTRMEAPSRTGARPCHGPPRHRAGYRRCAGRQLFLRGHAREGYLGRDEPPAQPMGQRVVRVVLQAVRSAHGKTV